MQAFSGLYGHNSVLSLETASPQVLVLVSIMTANTQLSHTLIVNLVRIHALYGMVNHILENII